MSVRLILCLLSVALALDGCVFSKDGVTYDLNTLSRDLDYQVVGREFSVNRKRIFYFNVCRNTVAVPKDGENEICKSTPHEIKDGQTIMTELPAPVFMTYKASSTASTTCSRLGTKGTDSANYAVGLYDISYPATGVTIKYQQGDYCCPKAACQTDADYRQTTFKVNFLCGSLLKDFPDETYYEIANKCDYMITIRTAAACPTECPLLEAQSCGSHGTCGYNHEDHKAQCFCFKNWSGELCTKYTNVALLDVNTYILILTVILVIVVITMILYIIHRLRKINVNPDSFKNLETRFNELGQMTY